MTSQTETASNASTVFTVIMMAIIAGLFAYFMASKALTGYHCSPTRVAIPAPAKAPSL